MEPIGIALRGEGLPDTRRAIAQPNIAVTSAGIAELGKAPVLVGHDKIRFMPTLRGVMRFTTIGLPLSRQVSPTKSGRICCLGHAEKLQNTTHCSFFIFYGVDFNLVIKR